MPITVKVSDEILNTIPTLNEGAVQGLIELGRETDEDRTSVNNLQRRQDIDLARIRNRQAAFARDDHSGIRSWVQTTVW